MLTVWRLAGVKYWLAYQCREKPSGWANIGNAWRAAAQWAQRVRTAARQRNGERSA
jgi:hypothetical protein